MSDNKILTVGRTNGAYGVRGWVRVVPFEEPEILAATKRWFLTDIRGNTKTLEVEELKVHGQMLIARIRVGMRARKKLTKLMNAITTIMSPMVASMAVACREPAS